METLRSPITGSGGGLPGTGRAPTILPAPSTAPTAEGSESAAAFAEVAAPLFVEPVAPEPAIAPTTALEGSELLPEPDPGSVQAPGAPLTTAELPPPAALSGVDPGLGTALATGTGQPASGSPPAQVRSHTPPRASAGVSPPVDPEPFGPALPPSTSEPALFQAAAEAALGDGAPELPAPEVPVAAAPETGAAEAFAAPESASHARGDATAGPSAVTAPTTDAAELERAAEVLRQIKAEIRPGARRIRVDLDPPELGRLVIRAALADGKVTAVVEAESARTLDLLERQAPELLAALREAGVEAKSLSLELSSNHSRGQGSGQGGETEHTPFQSVKDVEHDERANRREYRTRTSNAGDGVDTYA